MDLATIMITKIGFGTYQVIILNYLRKHVKFHGYDYHFDNPSFYTPFSTKLLGGILVSLRSSVRLSETSLDQDQTGPKTSPEPHRRITEPHKRITINILGIFGTS